MRNRLSLALATVVAIGLSGLGNPAKAGLLLTVRVSDGVHADQVFTSSTGSISTGVATIGNFSFNITTMSPPALGTFQNGVSVDQTQTTIDVHSTTGTGTLTVTTAVTGLSFQVDPLVYPGPNVGSLESNINSTNLSGTGSTYDFQAYVDQANQTTATGTAVSTGLQGPYAKKTSQLTLAQQATQDVLRTVNQAISGPFSLIGVLHFKAAANGAALTSNSTVTAYATPEPATFAPVAIAAVGGILYGLRRHRKVSRGA